jgi:hypothetical protein
VGAQPLSILVIEINAKISDSFVKIVPHRLMFIKTGKKTNIYPVKPKRVTSVLFMFKYDKRLSKRAPKERIKAVRQI